MRTRAGPHGDLILRTTSSLVMVGIALGAWWYGGWAFAISMAAIASLVSHEWSRLTQSTMKAHLVFGLAAFSALDVLFAHTDPRGATGLVLAVAMLLLLSGTMDRRRIWAALGLFYACLPTISLVILRDEVWGLEAVAIVYAVVWTTDTAAYFTGRHIGGPRLWPAVSPGKTWSGAVGGVTAGVIAGLVVGLVSGTGTLWWMGLVALVLAIVSALGDLLESAIKRSFGAKDSGALIPGHGGVMDRVDGMLAAACAALVIGWVHAMSAGFATASSGLLVWSP